MNNRVADNYFENYIRSRDLRAPAQFPGSRAYAGVRYEFVGSDRVAARRNVIRAREKSSLRSWIWANPAYGIPGRSHFEEHVHIFSRLLVPSGGVWLDFDAQVWVATQKLFKQWRKDEARHGDGTSNLDEAAWPFAMALQ